MQSTASQQEGQGEREEGSSAQDTGWSSKQVARAMITHNHQGWQRPGESGGGSQVTAAVCRAPAARLTTSRDLRPFTRRGTKTSSVLPSPSCPMSPRPNTHTSVAGRLSDCSRWLRLLPERRGEVGTSDSAAESAPAAAPSPPNGWLLLMLEGSMGRATTGDSGSSSSRDDALGAGGREASGRDSPPPPMPPSGASGAPGSCIVSESKALAPQEKPPIDEPRPRASHPFPSHLEAAHAYWRVILIGAPINNRVWGLPGDLPEIASSPVATTHAVLPPCTGAAGAFSLLLVRGCCPFGAGCQARMGGP